MGEVHFVFSRDFGENARKKRSGFVLFTHVRKSTSSPTGFFILRLTRRFDESRAVWVRREANCFYDIAFGYLHNNLCIQRALVSLFAEQWCALFHRTVSLWLQAVHMFSQLCDEETAAYASIVNTQQAYSLQIEQQMRQKVLLRLSDVDRLWSVSNPVQYAEKTKFIHRGRMLIDLCVGTSYATCSAIHHLSKHLDFGIGTTFIVFKERLFKNRGKKKYMSFLLFQRLSMSPT